MTVKFINKTYLDKKVKVIFRDHDPRITMIGLFVNVKDAEELGDKNFIRFVNQTRIDAWFENPNIGLTKIYKADDFALVIPV